MAAGRRRCRWWAGCASICPALGVDDSAPDFGERLCQLSRDNHPYDFEFSAQGELIVIMPSGWDTGANEQAAAAKLGAWQDENGGLSFPPTVMFNLPSGARLYAGRFVDYAGALRCFAGAGVSEYH